MGWLVTRWALGQPSFFVLLRVRSISQVLCPKDETLKMEKLYFVSFVKLGAPNFLSLEHFPPNLHESPAPPYTLDGLEGDLNDIKLEHPFWYLPLLNSHGNMAKAFRDFIPTSWLTAKLANSTHTPLGTAVPGSSFTRDEVIVLVRRSWTLSASSAFVLWQSLGRA